MNTTESEFNALNRQLTKAEAEYSGNNTCVYRWLLDASDNHNYDNYEPGNVWLESLGLSASGYNLLTNQRFITLRFDTVTHRELERKSQGVMKVISHIEPIPSGERCIMIRHPRMDEFALELRVNKAGRVRVVQYVNRHIIESFKFTDLKTALSFIQLKHSCDC
ncbi:hypothetical protein P9911_003805 [Klebsiella oxytoca]|uniref:hypothetical protein n=1 Tax=Klebsiella oxytoca TaxID=571 RepID=UPI00254D812D|nr:hypothetical protein [Klebsiella oxytoca]MEC5504974.1 hypothetical protein [Klebsiella oxytoca]